ncbi:MAG: energy-coupling factor ABC transporter ATP-binding protein [Clostridia bacterium]|uniref:energy-coupling factor ABC transporter ATP-binding protein n=1 Tax=Desulfitibacter alkalitolerans TaxID=264641 RepID=UPI000480F535|nr:energy-coupling factor ABC transporter ATP-binding protein [Desulfitibacter alkalitolerans]MBS3969035.1 energy-coupling factor ABC transporter ATP-binding protein [Clostridia bacterium]
MEPLVKVRCLRHVYPDKTEVSLCGLDFIVHNCERVVVLGANGAGKTTLLAHILGLLKPLEGSVEVMELQPHKDFSILRKNIGVVFQNVDEQIIGPRVYDDIAFSLRNERLPRIEIDARVNAIARELKIEDLLNKIPHYLSGGQKKKVALAGAIVTMPRLLVMDEPFDSLDAKSKWEMVCLLNKLNNDYSMTLIITTHNMNLVPYIADTVYLINEGKIQSRGTPREILNNVDMIKKANLEPPILVELFSRLKDKGYNLNIPIVLEEAERELGDIFQEMDKKVK